MVSTRTVFALLTRPCTDCPSMDMLQLSYTTITVARLYLSLKDTVAPSSASS